MSVNMGDNEPDTKLITVLEVSYKGKIIFSKQFDCLINEMDIRVDTDMKNLPTCKSCKNNAVDYKQPAESLCNRCLKNKKADEDASVDQMFAIGYW